MQTAAFFFSHPLPYGPCTLLQEACVRARHEGRLDRDIVFFLEHYPVITLGRRGKKEHILVSPERLKEMGIEVFNSGRGGDVTFHGPGQIVVYPILRLAGEEADAHRYVFRLEEMAIRTAADFGVTAYRRTNLTGIWTSQGKLGAIGVRFTHWITHHGMSVNVNLSPRAFDVIVPCGLAGEPVTSLKTLRGTTAPHMNEVRQRLAHHFTELFERPLAIFTVKKEWPALLAGLAAEIPGLQLALRAAQTTPARDDGTVHPPHGEASGSVR